MVYLSLLIGVRRDNIGRKPFRKHKIGYINSVYFVAIFVRRDGIAYFKSVKPTTVVIKRHVGGQNSVWIYKHFKKFVTCRYRPVFILLQGSIIKNPPVGDAVTARVVVAGIRRKVRVVGNLQSPVAAGCILAGGHKFQCRVDFPSRCQVLGDLKSAGRQLRERYRYP